MRTFYVMVKEEFRKTCFACGGVGKKTTSMQGQKFTKPCSYCNGKGFTSGTRTTEVPLVDALKALKEETKSDNGDNCSKTDVVLTMVNDLIKKGCDYFHVAQERVCSHTRAREVVDLRYILFWHCRKRFGLTFNEAGRLIGGHDHATVKRAVEQVYILRQSDKLFAEKFEGFQKFLAMEDIKDN